MLELDPALEQEYEEHAKRFFNRFSDLKTVSPSRREEAAKFLARREHYRDVGLYFAAIQRGDMEAADQAIAMSLEKLDQTVGTSSEADYWRIVWQARRECLRARAELLKGPEILNMTVMADAYEAAARECVPPDVSDIPEKTRLRIMFYQCMHRSQAERWRANAMLARSRGGFDSLNRALDHLTRSADEAQKATSIGHDRDAASHLEYVSYWKQIVLERVKLLEYAQDRRNEQLHAARAAIQEAETLARSIIRRVGEERVFPNRFYSVAHLALEPLWLDAIQEFTEGHCGSAAQILSKYCAQLPREFDGSWWHSNVRVRQLAASIMDQWQHDKAGLEAPFGELRNLVDEEGCGAAAETIFEDISLLLRNRKAAVDTQNDILRNWPLDATAEELPEPEQQTFRRWVESLPQEICTTFESSAFPGDEQFHSAWVQLLGILLDYYEPLDTDIPRLIRGFSRKTLTHRVLGLPALSRLADPSRRLILSLAADPKATWPQRACLLSLISKVPLLSRVQGPFNTAWNAWPRWSRTSPRKRTFRIKITSETTQDFSRYRFWFLPPDYKKGNLPTLHLRNGTLRPCHTWSTRLLTDSEIRELKRTASLQFEQKVREYLQPLLPLGYKVVHKTDPETDLLIHLEDRIWLGEIKFTELEALGMDDAEKAIKQLQIRADDQGRDRPIHSVVVTNAPTLPACLLDWCVSTEHAEVWQVLLNQHAKLFVENGDGEIEAILRVSRGASPLKLAPHHLLFGGVH